MELRTLRACLSVFLIPITLAGCFSGEGSDLRTTTSSQSGLTVASGTKAVKIVFSLAPTGSFETDTTKLGSGTAPAVGSGLQVTRLYDPTTGSAIATSGPSGSDWPTWITRIELGISGTTNTSAQSGGCAKFADASESANTCDFDGDGTYSDLCGTPSGYFRVSDWDCQQSTIANGAGTASDGVYVRVQFNRATQYLGSAENVLVLLEYATHSPRRSATAPTDCVTAGTFDPSASGCADLLWQAYLKRLITDTTAPFMMVVPPTIGRIVLPPGGTTPVMTKGLSTKQILLPLSSDSSLSIFQLSRTTAMPLTTTVPIGAGAATVDTMCNPNGAGAGSGSAGCFGVTLYSMTLIRM